MVIPMAQKMVNITDIFFRFSNMTVTIKDYSKDQTKRVMGGSC